MSRMRASSLQVSRSFLTSSTTTPGRTTTAQSAKLSFNSSSPSSSSQSSSSQIQIPSVQLSDDAATQAQTAAVQRLYLLLPNHKCPNKKNCPFHPPEEQEDDLEEAEITLVRNRRSMSQDDRTISEQLLAEKLAKINQQISSNLLEGNKLHFPRKTSHDISLPTADLDRLRYDHASSTENVAGTSSTREESVASDYDLDSGVTLDSCSDRELDEESLPQITEELVVPDVVSATEFTVMKDEEMEEDQPTLQVEANIHVNEVTNVDSGTFTLQEQNVPEVTKTNVTVSAQVASQQRPYFKKELKYTTVTEGSQVTLECVATGDPMPDIKWYKDEKRISSPGRYKIHVTEDDTATLAIDRAEMGDTGLYKCVASNVAGSASTESKIRVQNVVEDKPVPAFQRPQEKKAEKHKLDIAPEFTAKLKNKSVPEGTTARLHCSVEGIPKPHVKWFKDSKEIYDGSVYEMKNNGGLLSLEIVSAKLSVAGKYTVEASNSEGTVSCSCVLEVEGDEEPDIFESDSTRPKFITKIKDVHVREGEDATFTCTAAGKPIPTIKWQRDMVNISPSERVEMEMNNQGHVHLTIKKVQPSDSGLYYCAAQSKSGRTKCCAYLYVKALRAGSRDEPPEFIERSYSRLSSEERGGNLGTSPSLVLMLPDTLDVVVGERLKLDSSVQGYPIPLVTWHKGDRELMYSQRHRIMLCGTLHTMEIPQVMALDKGEYIVRATNVYGTVQSSCYVNILNKGSKVSPADYKREAMIHAARQNLQAPFFTKQLPKTIDALNGMSVRLDCILHDGVELNQWPSSQPSVEKSEKVKKELIDEGFVGEFIPSEAKSHHKPPPQHDDEKQFVIVDKSRDHEQKSERPSFQTTSLDLEQSKGSEALIECSTRGHPEPEVKWYKDDKPLTANSKFKVNTQGSKHTLRITDVSTSDTGEYTCKASNSAGSESWKARLRVTESVSEIRPSKEEPVADEKLVSHTTVQETSVRKDIITQVETVIKPAFTQTLPKTASASHGDDVEFVCGLTSLDLAEVKWELDGRELPKDAHYRVFSDKSSGNYGLEIQSVTEKDSAKYTCVVITKDGDLIHTSTRLTVTAKPQVLQKEQDFEPHFTTELKDTLVKDGEGLILECDIDGNPRPQISWHRDGIEIFDSQDFQISTIGCHCKLQINEIYPEDEGRYSCKGVNSLGEAVSSCYVTVEDLGGYISADSASTTSSRSYDRTRTRRGEANEGELKKKAKKEKEEPEVAPELVVKPRRQFVDDGGNAKFKASFDGSKNTVLFWSKDGQVLSEDDHFKVYQADGFHFLEVLNVSVQDNGMYKVTVQNSVGSDASEAELEVFEKPKLLTRSGPEWEQSLQDVTVELGDMDVEMVCISKDVTQPSAKWFQNGRELFSGFHIKLNHTAQTATMIIKEVQERDAGEFRCVITGKNGVLETSCTLKLKDEEQMEPPVFEKGLHDMEVNEGDKLELDVAVKEEDTKDSH